MQNFFLVDYFDWHIERHSIFDRTINRFLGKLGLQRRIALSAAFDAAVNRLVDKINPQHRPEPIASLSSGVLTSVEQRMNMYHFVAQVLAYDVPGDLVELGCYEGQSAILIQKTILGHDPTRRLHLYDSFEGLPPITDKDGTTFRQGWLAIPEEIVRDNFRKYELPAPVIHKGWFKDTLPHGLPERICFAHLDGDLYDSILVSFEHVYPRLSKGAICLIDDYCDPAVNPRGWNQLPGVKQACDEFLHDKPEKVSGIYAGAYSHGFFRKL
jgi:O-methyltransferase